MSKCTMGYGDCNQCGYCKRDDECSTWNNDNCWPKPTQHICGDVPGPSPFCPPGPFDHPESTLRGQNLYEKYWQLDRHVKFLSCKVEKTLGVNAAFIKNLESVAIDEGAYYSDKEIKVENNYSTDDASTYQLIKFKDKDCKGIPITMELRLAANNTSNAQITEDPFTASKMEYADKLIPAIQFTGNGWFGNPIYQGAPIPGNDEPDLYTAGFNFNGRLQVFSNNQSSDDLVRAKIKNAMGVYGIVCSGKAVANPNQYAKVPNKDNKDARVFIGQNYDTRETFIICSSNYENSGLRTITGGEILASYGCDIGVEVCQGNSVIALDKGGVVTVPHETSITPTYAYWYITKKCQYRRQSTFNLGFLTQQYGSLYWKTILNQKAIEDLIGSNTNHEERITQLENELRQLEIEVTELETKLDKEIQDRIDAIADLQDQINALDPDAIRDQIQAIITRIGNVEIRVDTLESNVSQLTANLDSLKTTVDSHYAELVVLQGKVNDHTEQIASLQNQFSTLDTAFVDLLAAFAEIENAFTEIKSQWSDILIQFNNLVNLVNTFDQRITELENEVSPEAMKIYYTPSQWGGGTSSGFAPFLTLPLNSIVIGGMQASSGGSGWPASATTEWSIYGHCARRNNATMSTTNQELIRFYFLTRSSNGNSYTRTIYGNNATNPSTDTGWLQINGSGGATNLEPRVEALEISVTNLTDRVSSVETDLTNLSGNVSQNTSDITSINSRIDGLTSPISNSDFYTVQAETSNTNMTVNCIGKGAGGVASTVITININGANEPNIITGTIPLRNLFVAGAGGKAPAPAVLSTGWIACTQSEIGSPESVFAKAMLTIPNDIEGDATIQVLPSTAVINNATFNFILPITYYTVY